MRGRIGNGKLELLCGGGGGVARWLESTEAPWKQTNLSGSHKNCVALLN